MEQVRGVPEAMLRSAHFLIMKSRKKWRKQSKFLVGNSEVLMSCWEIGLQKNNITRNSNENKGCCDVISGRTFLQLLMFRP